MSSKLVTERFDNCSIVLPADGLEEGKILLCEGAGAPFLAPANLIFVIHKPVYIDWAYETDGRVNRGMVTLVYGERWVNQPTDKYPYTKELRKILKFLKKELNWSLPDWGAIIKAESDRLIREQGGVSDKNLVAALENDLCLKKSGFVWKDELRRDGDVGRFWGTSASPILAGWAPALEFENDRVYPDTKGSCDDAYSVRCVLA